MRKLALRRQENFRNVLRLQLPTICVRTFNSLSNLNAHFFPDTVCTDNTTERYDRIRPKTFKTNIRKDLGKDFNPSDLYRLAEDGPLTILCPTAAGTLTDKEQVIRRLGGVRDDANDELVGGYDKVAATLGPKNTHQDHNRSSTNAPHYGIWSPYQMLPYVTSDFANQSDENKEVIHEFLGVVKR